MEEIKPSERIKQIYALQPYFGVGERIRAIELYLDEQAAKCSEPSKCEHEWHWSNNAGTNFCSKCNETSVLGKETNLAFHLPTKPSNSGGEKEVKQSKTSELCDIIDNMTEYILNEHVITCLSIKIFNEGYSKTPKSNGLVELDKTSLEREAKSYRDQWYKDNDEYNEKLGSICGFIWERILPKFGTQPRTRVISVEEITNIILEGSKKVYIDAPTLAQEIYVAIYGEKNQ